MLGLPRWLLSRLQQGRCLGAVQGLSDSMVAVIGLGLCGTILRAPG